MWDGRGKRAATAPPRTHIWAHPDTLEHHLLRAPLPPLLFAAHHLNTAHSTTAPSRGPCTCCCCWCRRCNCGWLQGPDGCGARSVQVGHSQGVGSMGRNVGERGWKRTSSTMQAGMIHVLFCTLPSTSFSPSLPFPPFLPSQAAVRSPGVYFHYVLYGALIDMGHQPLPTFLTPHPLLATPCQFLLHRLPCGPRMCTSTMCCMAHSSTWGSSSSCWRSTPHTWSHTSRRYTYAGRGLRRTKCSSTYKGRKNRSASLAFLTW